MQETSEPIRLSRIPQRILLFVCLVVSFECLVIAVAPRLHSGSVLKIAKDSILLRVRVDSWFDMAQGDLAWRQRPAAIYENVFFRRGIRFIYPPTSLLLYRACFAARYFHGNPFSAFKLLLLASLLGTSFLAAEFFSLLLPSSTVENFTAVERWTIRLSIALLIYIFLPLINGYFLGQIQTLITFMLVLSALYWLRGRQLTAGIAIGLTCLLKPQMMLFLVWGILRRRWNFTISLGVTLLLGAALSVAVFGWHNTIEYAAVLRYLARHGDALFTNQSLNGMLHREMHVGSPVTWVYGYPPYNRTIYLATLISSALFLAVALAIPTIRKVTGTTSDFLIFAMAAIMASPIAWEHHYGIFFLVFLLWMPRAFDRWPVFFTLLGIYLLMTDNWAPVTLLMYTPWTFLISHVFFGGMILFFWTVFADVDFGNSNRSMCRRESQPQEAIKR